MTHTERWLALAWLASLGGACTAAKSDVDTVPPFAPSLVTSCAEADVPCFPLESAATSCCQTLWVPGGTFAMGFSASEVPFPNGLAVEDADHPVAVSGFYLDRFEISVGRFAKYARQYSGAPGPDSGGHPLISGSGWRSEWDAELPLDRAALLDQVAIDDPDAVAESDLPMSRLSWFVAFAFCVWDGGRLPTEAEWEYAATGGEQNRAYPWGDDPAPVAELATLGRAGAHPSARGRFGHDDLAGGTHEWVLDWFSERFYVEGGLGCRDCANLAAGLGRAVRGERDASCCAALDTEFRSAARNLDAPGLARSTQGARCARDVR